jgi:hypothetical protein
MGAHSLRLSIVFSGTICRVRLSIDRRHRQQTAADRAVLGDFRERNARDVVQKQGQADTVSGRRSKMAAVQIMVDSPQVRKQKLVGHALLWLSENDGKGIGV